MNCLKCGRDIQDDKVFCQDCLLKMEKYPVTPGTAVILPSRRRAVPKKMPKRRNQPTPEEQLKVARKRLRNVSIAFVILLILTIALSIPAIQHIFSDHYRPGQNYSVVATTTESIVPAETASVLSSEEILDPDVSRETSWFQELLARFT